MIPAPAKRGRTRRYPTNADRQHAYRERKRNAHREAEALRNGSDEWFTPAAVVELARQVLGVIDLDPASNEVAQRTVRATRWFSKADNGLTHPWEGRVFLNPPYSFPLVRNFTRKLIEEHNTGHVAAAILIVNNATDAQWFQDLLARFPVCLTRGRIKFYRADRAPVSPRLGQAIFYLGSGVERFAEVFSVLGVVR